QLSLTAHRFSFLNHVKKRAYKTPFSSLSQPFTAPAVIPFTSLSWKIMNITIIGSSVSVRTAMIIGVFMEYCPWNSQIARGSVRFSEDCVNVYAKENSFHIFTPL